MDPIMGTIILFAGDSQPRGWFYCDGRLLSIAQYSALFSILGTTYGGDGMVTFALPNLQSRVPVGAGTGPGLSTYQLGEATGTESNTLLVSNLPAHTHILAASTAQGDQMSPANNYLAATGSEIPPIGPYTSSNPSTAMGVHSVSPTGGGLPVNNLQPLLALNYIIAYEGIYPSRS